MQSQKAGLHSMVPSSNNAQSELVRLSEELAAGKLVKNLTLFPALQVTLVHPDMTREFEQACQVLYSDPLLLLGKYFGLLFLSDYLDCDEKWPFLSLWRPKRLLCSSVSKAMKKYIAFCKEILYVF